MPRTFSPSSAPTVLARRASSTVSAASIPRHVACLALGAPFPLGGVIPCAPLLAHGLLLTPQPLGQQVTGRGQGTRASPHHPDAPPGQHGGLGLAQMGPML